MIDITKFDPAVLARYQASHLSRYQTAREVADRFNPPTLNPNFNYEKIWDTQGLHQARFQLTVEEERDYKGTELTRTPQYIEHHLNQVINRIKHHVPWAGLWYLWEGMKFSEKVNLIYEAPNELYDRLGAAILLAQWELDPTKEIQRYFDDWKVRYQLALEKLDAQTDRYSNKLRSRKKRLEAYHTVLNQFGSELIIELTKVITPISHTYLKK